MSNGSDAMKIYVYLDESGSIHKNREQNILQ